MKRRESLLQYSTQEFVELLKSNRIRRLCFVYDGKKEKVISSPRILNPMIEYLNAEKKDFNFHKGLFSQITKNYDTLMGAFVRRTKGKIAVQPADKLSKQNHPIFGHRGQQIINSLVEDKWYKQDK
jgi:hypothetical protein